MSVSSMWGCYAIFYYYIYIFRGKWIYCFVINTNNFLCTFTLFQLTRVSLFYLQEIAYSKRFVTVVLYSHDTETDKALAQITTCIKGVFNHCIWSVIHVDESFSRHRMNKVDNFFITHSRRLQKSTLFLFCNSIQILSCKHKNRGRNELIYNAWPGSISSRQRLLKLSSFLKVSIEQECK